MIIYNRLFELLDFYNIPISTLAEDADVGRSCFYRLVFNDKTLNKILASLNRLTGVNIGINDIMEYVFELPQNEQQAYDKLVDISQMVFKAKPESTFDKLMIDQQLCNLSFTALQLLFKPYRE